MFPTGTVDRTLPKREMYRDLAASLASLLADEPDAVANLANASALLAQTLDRVNWCGFYLARGRDLVLGPFQGKTACVRIPLGKGVCGAAAERRKTLLVEDVERFAGHIVCDPASRSEIVVPIVREATLLGVLDVDAPEPRRFDDLDRDGLEGFVRTLIPLVNWDSLLRT